VAATDNLIKAPDERAQTLASRRALKMARSAHAYVRGSTAKFYEWLDASIGKTPDGPPIWICGDCHLGNLGPLADVKGRVSVQIRDLDQTVIGNPAHDLIRLGLSLASAARGSDLPGVVTARILEHLAGGYTSALAGEFDLSRDRSARPKAIQSLLRRSVRRRWKHLAAERLDTVEPRVPLGRRFWPLAAEEAEGLRELFADPSVSDVVSGLQARGSGTVELVDAAYWMKGCSSLGRLRYAVMLRVGEGENSCLCLMDVKEATTAAAPRAPDLAMPRDNALRVVTGAKALSPNLGNRMLAARLLGKGVVLRELMPQDLKIEVDRLGLDEATSLARYLAGVVGRAHGRQMDAATREDWRLSLIANSKSSLDAPGWLWTNVVELLGTHEAAYLDHCRRYALGPQE
jgi:uncharacterized protein (DUF2252 family)